MKQAIVLLALIGTACQADVDRVQSQVATAPQASTVEQSPVATIGQIIGEWRVAGVAEKSIDQPEGISATIAPEYLHIVAGCVNLRWSLAIDAGNVRLNRVATESCARGLTPTEEALVVALTSASRAYRLPSNALVFDGPAGEVTLFTQ